MVNFADAKGYRPRNAGGFWMTLLPPAAPKKLCATNHLNKLRGRLSLGPSDKDNPVRSLAEKPAKSAGLPAYRNCKKFVLSKASMLVAIC